MVTHEGCMSDDNLRACVLKRCCCVCTSDKHALCTHIDHAGLIPHMLHCGIQSSGKSSVLESVVGTDLLPRRSGATLIERCGRRVTEGTAVSKLHFFYVPCLTPGSMWTYSGVA